MSSPSPVPRTTARIPKPYPRMGGVFGGHTDDLNCRLSGSVILPATLPPHGRCRPPFETSTYTKILGLMLRITRVLWGTGKAVIMYIDFCVLIGLLEIMKRGVYGRSLIKRGAIVLWRFMETVLNITLGQKILLM